MTDTDDERRLVEAARTDPSQFGALYERHVDRVYAFVFLRVRNRDAAEDITADVFHRALANLVSFEWRGAPFGAWLIRIATNAVADRWRRTRETVSEVPELAVTPALDDFERRAHLYRYVDELGEPQRTVIIER